MGATAILSRSSFAACAGGAIHTQATVTTKPATSNTRTTDPRHRDLRIHYLLKVALVHARPRGGTGTVALVTGRYICWHSAHAVISPMLSALAGSVESYRFDDATYIASPAYTL